MCGINGVFEFEATLPPDALSRRVSRMNDCVVHRGPDDSGAQAWPGAALGMRRLSIIDLESGHQPIQSLDGRYSIVMNGEIYNYKSLRSKLVDAGHSFRTSGDVEVALKCFEQYGAEGFSQLSGMFAIAIYDNRDHELTLARDRAGEKPLHYYVNGHEFVFASELKSIIRTTSSRFVLDSRAIEAYLQLTYIPAPLTAYDGISKLLPGHYLKVNHREVSTPKEYWDVDYSESRQIPEYSMCKRALRKTLFDAVEESMVADVPLGTFLSGGIDSTVVTGIASQISSKPISTFTAKFGERRYDESPQAQLSADLHRTNHHVISLNYEDALPELDSILRNFDEPFGDSSYIPTYMISKAARQHVKTVLTGDAGDELFGGYSKYLIGYYSKYFNLFPSWISSPMLRLANGVLPPQSHVARKVNKVARAASLPIFEQREQLMSLGFHGEELRNVLLRQPSEYTSRFIREKYDKFSANSDEMTRALYLDFKVVLEGDMLTKVDRASMLASLETRTPMLNKDVVEVAARIPSKYKIRSRATKIILKETFSDLIPPALLKAPKRGFSVPMGSWLRRELRAPLLETLSEDHVRDQGILQFPVVRNLLDEHLSGARDHSSQLWSLYVLQNWQMEYSS